MLLAIDAGNTNIVFALINKGDAPKTLWRIQTETARTADEYAAFLYPLFAQGGFAFSDVSAVVIGSVVPGANFHLSALCQKYLNVNPLYVGAPGTNHGLTITFPNPESLGADRVANVMAATAHYQTPMILIDFGTATKLEVIDASGAYIGGIIAPGLNMSADALHKATAKLPKIDLVKPDRVMGTDTISAMRSGVYWGYVSMIEGLVARLKAELNLSKPFVLVTGGLAPVFDNNINGVDKVDEMLTIQGLQMFYARNTAMKAAA